MKNVQNLDLKDLKDTNGGVDVACLGINCPFPFPFPNPWPFPFPGPFPGPTFPY